MIDYKQLYIDTLKRQPLDCDVCGLCVNRKDTCMGSGPDACAHLGGPCMELDYGTCPHLRGTPCEGCFDNGLAHFDLDETAIKDAPLADDGWYDPLVELPADPDELVHVICDAVLGQRCVGIGMDAFAYYDEDGWWLDDWPEAADVKIKAWRTMPERPAWIGEEADA